MGPGIWGRPCSLDRSYSRLQTDQQRLRPCLMLACELIKVELHRNHSSPDLSACNPFAKGYAWLIRFPCEIQYLSCQCFWRASKDFLSDVPTTPYISSFSSSSNIYLRSTSYNNPLTHVILLPLWNPDDIFI